jgi:thiamine biosynthesis lipoprotein
MKNTAYSAFSFQAMGTECRVQHDFTSYAEADAFKQQVVAWVREFENEFSRFRPESLINRINDSAGTSWVNTTPEAESLFSLCDWFYWSTNGVFDPAVLPLVKLWDYHAPRRGTPNDDEIADALAHCGWRHVRREKGRIFLPQAGMGLDVGGIGKEYAVDRVFEMGIQRGIRNILVDFGHDLRVHGEPPEGGPWRVGLEDPHDPGHCWGGVSVRDRAVATSGDYLRYFTDNGERYGHILDPRTGRPVHNGTSSVSVVSATCTEAGILSTSAFILGGEAGLNLLDYIYTAEGCISEKGRQYFSRRFHEYAI